MSRSHVHFEIELPLYLIYIYWNRYVGTLSRNMRALGMPDDKMAYFFYLQIILPVYVFIYQFAFSTSY